jgi:hypothetical protein
MRAVEAMRNLMRRHQSITCMMRRVRGSISTVSPFTTV